MRKVRQWITSFFGFSRSETNGFIVLLPLMAIAIFSAPAFRWWSSRSLAADCDPARLDSLVALWQWEKTSDTLTAVVHRFAFDPNTVTQKEMERLGFPPRVSKGLINYRNKGGQFRSRKDVAKLYGMDSVLMKQLYSYILLPAKTNQPGQARAAPFDLNLADSAQLVRLKGIGPVLSKRIIRYRDRLGGFVTMNQLNEVFGLDSVGIFELNRKSFIHEDFIPRRINVNSINEKNHRSLPYINFHLARSIATYRFQHGDFSSIDDLLQMDLMTDSLFQKIKPYLTVND